MVFSKELGYDPDEWEECSDSEQFMLFGFTTRMFLSFTSIILTILFFWFLEARKRIDKADKTESLLSKDFVDVEARKIAILKARLGKVEKLKEIETNFSKFVLQKKLETGGYNGEETEALQEWQREVARMEELRLRDMVAHVTNASGLMSEIETESQLIDYFQPADHISIETNSAEMELFEQIQRTVDQMSSPTTSDTLTVETEILSAPYAGDIASIQDATNTIVTSSEQGNGSGSSTNGWEAPAQSEFLVEPTLEVRDAMREDFGENEDDFVKVYEDQLQKSCTEILQEQITEPSRQTGTLKPIVSDNTTQEIPEQRKQTVMPELSSGRLFVPADMADYISQENRQQELSRGCGDEIFNFMPITLTEVVETKKPHASIEQTAEETMNLKVNIMESVERNSMARMATSDQPQSQQLTDKETKRLIEAEIYLQDAIEYVASEIGLKVSSGFMVEETTNNKAEVGGATSTPALQQVPISLEATSQMFGTNEIFEKGEGPLETDDAMTYAPEIQSIEIPPDEASVNSENLLDYFDEVAAECTDVLSTRQPMKTAENVTAQSIPSLRRSRSFLSTESQPQTRKRSSLLSVLGVTSMQEMLLALTSFEDLSNAMRKAGLECTNLIFGIDYTASNKYQGERCFQGQSLHSIDASRENPYQQVIKIMGRILAPFATSGYIPAYGFGDVKTSDWSVFKLKSEGECRDLDELLQVYDAITPTISLSGPTNFAPLIYEAIEICEKVQNYHILVIIADGQVTNEKATRKAIVRACQHPLSIIVVGVGDGPWDMMKVFDESLPRRPWDNFHFVEFHEVVKKAGSVDAGELSFAVQSLLEIPDQYNTVRQLGLLRSVSPVPEHATH